jgi:hypothetical protein
LRFRAAFVPVSLALVALLTFSPAFRAPFVYDDHALFSDPIITSPQGWYLSFLPEQTRPLTWLSFWLNYAIAGENPVWWHAVNLALHIAASVLLWTVISLILPREQAIVAAFLFALHPIQTEPVMYVFARGTLLAAVLCLLSLRWWIAGRYWIAVAWFGLALLAKEECAAFPMLLLLMNRADKRRPAERVPIAAMFTLALAATARVALVAANEPGSGAGPHAGIPPVDYFAAQGIVILRYFRLLAVPVGFSVDPGIPVPAVWPALAAWAEIAAYVAAALWRVCRD